MFTLSKPKIPAPHNMAVVKMETTYAPRRPNIASAILPPSVLPIGSNAKALEITPTNPPMQAGCRDIIASGGRVAPCMRVPTPRNDSTKPPPNALDLNNDSGKEGSFCVVGRSIIDVSMRPYTRSAREAAYPTSGPDMAKSNRFFTFRGGEANGVIEPPTPVATEGRIEGTPIVMLLCIAATWWPAS
mmetsp:Transcript_23962/g.66524  ORF Transcript_23962/g.66524 Transcript_23962/m.66524 type:complete len:187 (+) Transcript_23962:418-978(+)